MSLQQTIKQMRSKVQQTKGKVFGGKLLSGQIGGKLRGQFSGQKRLGGGKLMNTAKSTFDRASRQVLERKPNIIGMVKEFKPGSRLLRGQKSVGEARDASVMGTASKVSGGKAYRSGRGLSSRARDVSIAH